MIRTPSPGSESEPGVRVRGPSPGSESGVRVRDPSLSSRRSSSTVALSRGHGRRHEAHEGHEIDEGCFRGRNRKSGVLVERHPLSRCHELTAADTKRAKATKYTKTVFGEAGSEVRVLVEHPPLSRCSRGHGRRHEAHEGHEIHEDCCRGAEAEVRVLVEHPPLSRCHEATAADTKRTKATKFTKTVVGGRKRKSACSSSILHCRAVHEDTAADTKRTRATKYTKAVFGGRKRSPSSRPSHPLSRCHELMALARSARRPRNSRS